MTDQELMKMTFELALKGKGTTWPNPMVGCVIVKNDRIIGKGFHLRSGLDHAEINALKNCSESPEGATVYVNLEPCCHTNKQTPPCAQRLIKEKVKKVIISNLDPNPHVDGGGVELLRSAGIEVELGLLSEEGERLNEVFFHVQREKRPFVHLKMASTLDGRIAMPTGESKWITGEVARNHVHELRSYHQAVVIGAQTLRADDPKLNVRLPDYQGNQPYRVVFTESGNLPEAAQLLNDELKERTLIYSTRPLKFPKVKVIKDLNEALNDLYEQKLLNLFLEGGPTLSSSFLKAGLVDRVSLYLNPSFLGAGPNVMQDLGLKTLGERPRLKELSSKWLGEDLYLTGKL